MSKQTNEESLAKLRKLGKILRNEIAASKSMTEQELAAVREAIRIQTMEREQLKAVEQELHHKKEKKHHL
jgi:hypothetical protein